ncbi:MAG: hypothetical protein AAF608_02470 [Pseudomonadota bacterium]
MKQKSALRRKLVSIFSGVIGGAAGFFVSSILVGLLILAEALSAALLIDESVQVAGTLAGAMLLQMPLRTPGGGVSKLTIAALTAGSAAYFNGLIAQTL